MPVVEESRPTSLLPGGHLLAHNAVINLAGSILPMVVGCFAIPQLIRGFQIDRYGVLTLAWTVIGYFSLFDLGLGRALTKVIAEKMVHGHYKKDIPALVWTCLIFMVALGLVGGLILWLLSGPLVNAILKVPPLLKPEALQTFHLLCLATPLVVITSGLRGILEAAQRFDLINAVKIPMGILMFLGPLAVLPFSHSIFIAVTSLVAVRFMACLVFVLLLFRTMPGLRDSFIIERAALKPLLHFGSWMTVTNIVGPLMTYMDRFLVGALLSMSAVAYYTTPYDLIGTLNVFPASIVGVFFPAFAAAFVTDRSHASRLCAKAVKLIFIGLFPIVLGAITLAEPGLRLWLGAAFSQNSTRVLQYLAFGLLLNGLAQIPFALIQGAGRPDLTAKLHLLELPFYLLTVWWLIRVLGIQGAAMAYVLRVTFDTIMLFAISRRMLEHPRIAWSGSGKALTLPVALSLLVGGFLPLGVPIKAAFLFFAVTGFLGFAWFVLLDSQERAFGKSLLPGITGISAGRYPR